MPRTHRRVPGGREGWWTGSDRGAGAPTTAVEMEGLQSGREGRPLILKLDGFADKIPRCRRDKMAAIESCDGMKGVSLVAPSRFALER